jgi:hypothetical protein
MSLPELRGRTAVQATRKHALSGFPDLSSYCRDACEKLWGKPDRETPKQLRWNGDDAYSWKTFDPKKRCWYDNGMQCGGSTLELARYAKGKPPLKKGELRGELFFEAWADAWIRP